MEPAFLPNTTIPPTSPIPKKHIFRTVFFLILFLLVLGFVGLTGYYLYQIKTGNGVQTASEFNGAFSATTQNIAEKKVTPEEVLATIRPFNPTTGVKTAPITIVAFSDFECPFSQKEFSIFASALKQLEFGGAVRVIYKQFPLVNIHTHAAPAALAALCANDQKKFSDYYTYLFSTKLLDDTSLTKAATTLGLNTMTFSNCTSTQQHIPDIQQDLQDGIALGVRGTPTYFVNGTKVEGAIDLATWNKLLLAEIKK